MFKKKKFLIALFLILISHAAFAFPELDLIDDFTGSDDVNWNSSVWVRTLGESGGGDETKESIQSNQGNEFLEKVSADASIAMAYKKALNLDLVGKQYVFQVDMGTITESVSNSRVFTGIQTPANLTINNNPLYYFSCGNKDTQGIYRSGSILTAVTCEAKTLMISVDRNATNDLNFSFWVDGAPTLMNRFESTADANFFFVLHSTTVDSAGTVSSNWDNFYRGGSAFDLNILAPVVGESIGGIKTIDLNISDAADNISATDLLFDINISQGATNYVILNDGNVAFTPGLYCDSNTLSSLQTCHFDWNALSQANGEYLMNAIVIDIINDENASDILDGNFNISNSITASFTTTQLQALMLSPFQSGIYDFNSTSTIRGVIAESYKWFVDEVNVKIASGSTDYNFHYSAFNEARDYNISLIVTSNLGIDSQSDLNLVVNSPTITIADFNISSQLSLTNIIETAGFTMRCTTGDVTADLNYTVLLNSATLFSDTVTDNFSLHLPDQNVLDGENTIDFFCTTDSGLIDTETITFDAFMKNFYFIFDHTGAVLSGSSEYALGDINSVFVYSFDNNSVLDLVANNAVSFFASGDENSAIKVELGYSDITFPFTSRDFDLIVLDTNSVPVCYSRLQSFYQNVFYSSTERQTVLKNANTGCYQFAAKTKYGFGDSLSVSAFLVPQSYSLYLVEDGVKSLLAVIDGSSAGQTSLDALVLKKQFARTVVISKEGATIGKNCGGISSDCNTWTIVYKNTAENNSKVVATVYNGAVAQFSYTETSSPDNFDASFSSTDLNFNTELLTLVVTATRTNGTTKTFTVYFTPQGVVGFINPLVALVISFIVFLGGITLVSMRIVFGWFGAAIVIIALALLSFSVGAWYVIFMQAIMLIMLAYIGVTTYKQSLGAV